MVDFNSQISIMVDSMLNLETLWKFNDFKPNKQQREAILHVDGPLYITAGPGSGKTRVLLWRAVNLIVFHGVKPEEIFLSTFTEKAAHQLKEGLRDCLVMRPILMVSHTICPKCILGQCIRSAGEF